MPQNGLKSGCNWSNFGGKSGVDDAGSLLGSFPNIIFFRKKIHFLPPPEFFRSPAPCKFQEGAQPKFRCFISRNIRRITRFAPWDIFLICYGPQSKSTLRGARSNDLPWFPDTPYIGPTGPAMTPCRNCLGTP